MSGSVCSPDQSNPQSCYDCPSECHEEEFFERDSCCEHFNAVKLFSSAMLESLTEELFSRESFSVVNFATTATALIGLSSSDVAMQELEGVVYSGG